MTAPTALANAALAMRIRDVLVQFNWSNFGLDLVDDAETEWADALAEDLVAAIFRPRPVDWDKPLKPVMGVPASGCDCSHDGGHGLAPWPDRSRGHAEDCPAFGPRPDGGEGGNVAVTP